jgi:hypothetical protein
MNLGVIERFAPIFVNITAGKYNLSKSHAWSKKMFFKWNIINSRP